jgi:nitrous oxide reductase accessory protein NosL
MKTLLAPVLVAALALAAPAAADHHLADAKEHAACKYCGMDRAKFASSRMLVEYDDGSKVAACSLHCVAVDLAVEIDRTPVAIRVADMGTQQLVDAETAAWVVGGTRPGVMTRRGKWAFAGRAAAEAFAKENGGAVVSFEEAMKAAYEDMYQDTKAIREKRRAMRSKQPAAAERPAGHAH